MKPIEKTSYELFQMLRTRFSPMNVGDENADLTVDPSQAKFFSFVYREGKQDIAPVSVSIIDKRTLKVYYGSDLVNNLKKPNLWYDLLRELRYFAKSNLMNFDARDIHKDQLDTRDFEFIKTDDSAYTSSEVDLEESVMLGSKRKSYQALENARVVVYHKRSVDEEKRGARSRNIDSIFIENSSGERFRFPINYLNGARAMARHVSEGGTPYDTVGEYIVNTVREMRDLSRFKQISRKPAMENSEAGEIRDRVSETLNSMKREIFNMQKPRGYQQFVENFESRSVEETEDYDSESLKEKFTRRLRNEKMDEVLPTVQRVLNKKVTDNMEKVNELKLKDLDVVKKSDTEDDEDVAEYEDFEEIEEDSDEIQKAFYGEPGRAGQSKVGAFLQKLFTPKYTRKEAFGSRKMIFNRLQKAGYDEADAKEILGMYSRAIQVANKKITGEDPTRYNDNPSGWILNFSNADEVLDMAYKIFMSQLKKSNLEPGKVSHPTYGRTHESSLDEAAPTVEKFIKDPDANLILRQDPAADQMIRNMNFRKGSGLLSFIMSDIASRAIGNESDAVANFASQIADDISREGETFGTQMTPEYKHDRRLALMLAKKYLDDVKRISTDPEYADVVRKDPSDVYGKKKKRSGGVHEQFEQWVEQISEQVPGAVSSGPTATTQGNQQTAAAQNKTNPQVVKALSGGDAQAATQIKRVSDKLARGQKLSPKEVGIAADISKKALTTTNTAAATRTLTQDKHTESEIPTEDGITMQDIRLIAGEGKLTEKTIQQAIEVIRKQRKGSEITESTAHKISESVTENEIVDLFRKINR